MRKFLVGLIAASLPAIMGMGGFASAANPQVIVTPANTHGWSTSDTRPGGLVSYSLDSTAPGNPHNGALQLSTDSTTTAKAQYLHNTNEALADVTQLSYYTKQITPAGTVADPSYQVVSCLLGSPTSSSCPGFTTLVYEPYQGGQGAIVNDQWQQWNIDSTGLFWSSRTVNCPGGTINGTPGGPASYTIAQINALCPSAHVIQFGVNVGTNNPLYNVETDLFNFNGVVYNFEPFNIPTNKDQCKNYGWMNVTDNNGNHFKNQGQCESFFNHESHDEHH